MKKKTLGLIAVMVTILLCAGGCAKKAAETEEETVEVSETAEETVEVSETTVAQAEAMKILEGAQKDYEYWKLSQEEMSRLRELFKENSTENWWNVSSNGEAKWPVWYINEQYALIIDEWERDRELLVVDEKNNTRNYIREKGYSETSNADVTTRNTILATEKFTIEFCEDVARLWTYGEIVMEIDFPDLSGPMNLFYSGEDYYVSKGNRLFKLDIKNEKFDLIADDFGGYVMDTFCNALFYINNESKLTFVNLITMKKEIVSEETCVDIKGSDWLRGVTPDGEIIEINTEKYYIPW